MKRRIRKRGTKKRCKKKNQLMQQILQRTYVPWWNHTNQHTQCTHRQIFRATNCRTQTHVAIIYRDIEIDAVPVCYGFIGCVFFFFLLSAERQRTELYAAYNTAKWSPPALAQTHTMSSVDDSISKYEQFFFCLHQSKIHAQRSVIKKMIFFSLQNQKTQTNQWKKLNSNKRNIMFEVDIEPCVISALAWAKKNIFV